MPPGWVGVAIRFWAQTAKVRRAMMADSTKKLTNRVPGNVMMVHDWSQMIVLEWKHNVEDLEGTNRETRKSQNWREGKGCRLGESSG